MPKSVYALSILAALCFGSAALAQQATEEAPAAPDAAVSEGTVQPEAAADAAQPVEDAAEPAAEDAGKDAAFSTGREVSEDPVYIKEELGDWQIRCFRNEKGEDPCQMYQLLKEASGNPIAEFSIFRIEGSGPVKVGASIVVPLLTMLPDELQIAIDSSAPKSYAYRFCSPAGCVAQIGLTDADVEAYKRGVKATLTLVPAQAPDQKVRIDVSLKGFTAAMDKVSVFTE